MEMIIDCPGDRLRYARGPFEIVQGGAFHGARSAEMHQQRSLPARTNSGNVVQRGGREAFRPLLPVCADRESMRFVPEALQVEEQGRVRRQGQFSPAGHMEGLSSRVAVRSLRYCDDRDVVDSRFLHHLAGGRELPFASIDDNELG